jgi:hypothetical protein
MVMIPMFHGDNLSVAYRLHSTDQTEVKTEENILPRGIFFLKYRRLNNFRDLTPHIGRIIYFHVIKVNINKA